jgi:hypothetical protein
MSVLDRVHRTLQETWPRRCRPLYLAALFVLQLSLVLDCAKPLAQAISIAAAPGLAPRGWPVLLQITATIAAVAGTTLLLALPAVALLRHWRDGPRRFGALPRWAIAVALGGVAILSAGVVLGVLTSFLPLESRMTAILIARPAAIGGLSLAAGGVLAAEVLRYGDALPSSALSEGEP